MKSKHSEDDSEPVQTPEQVRAHFATLTPEHQAAVIATLTSEQKALLLNPENGLEAELAKATAAESEKNAREENHVKVPTLKAIGRVAKSVAVAYVRPIVNAGKPSTKPSPTKPVAAPEPWRREKISAAGGHTASGELACPKCGGTQFTAKRSNKGKVGLGLVVLPAALLAPKSQVKCVTCGAMFRRG